MRLWDYRLIPVLPNAQLKAMRYEIGDMIKQYPYIKNGLVKYANKYDVFHLFYYFYQVTKELENRKINMNQAYNQAILEIAYDKSKKMIFVESEHYIYPEHNDRYLKQCFYNLEEKFDRGIITDKEWQEILKIAYEEDIIE